jgi:ribokinase
MILVIGSSNTDMVVKTSRFCQPGETILGGEFYMFPGGKGGNQAVAAARLGGSVTFISKLGNDIFGKNAIAGYEKEGIDTRHILVDEQAPSGVALITVNEQGENTIVVASGANHCILPRELESVQFLFAEADIILLQLEIPLPVVENAIGLAKFWETKVILNPAPAQLLTDDIYENLFALTPNETEAEILTGIKVVDEVSAAKAAESFRAKGVQNILITLGANGAYLLTESYTGMIPAPVVTAVDSTAAGDVFNGALAVALEQNRPWAEAAEFACRAASISVTRMGAQSSAPRLHELK